MWIPETQWDFNQDHQNVRITFLCILFSESLLCIRTLKKEFCFWLPACYEILWIVGKEVLRSVLIC